MFRSILIVSVLLVCGLDCEAKEKGKIELGKSALEMLYIGDPPGSVKEAVERLFEPRKKFCLVEKVWDKEKKKWVYREVKKK